MEIYEALKKDHDLVKGLMNQLVNLSERESDLRHDLIEMIRDELVPHSRAEEAVFYNSMRMLDSSKGIAMHGYQEHMEAEALLRSLQVQEKIDVKWRETAQKLKRALENHITEEEGEMFEAARSLFTKEEAIAMGEVFEQMKPEVKAEGIGMTTIEMLKNLMPPRLMMSIDDLSVPFISKNENGKGSGKTSGKNSTR
jgi:hemerythrin superfamily protein